ncbi:D-alanyl-D-alanine carboxypeptidase family protein [Candidatus Methylocalor cossyra]|uniref:D-alanyl-D-alanine carboxypeptidase n=1 Tax=Candidatus Methylocalor cossyra TaxID=3108543 RepID=A0ABP1C7L8_9GAMM
MHRPLPIWLPLVLAVLLSRGVLAGPYSALVAHVDTERVLYERNADDLRYPASLAKMMTLYLVFEALASGQVLLDTVFRASRFAILQPPSRLGLGIGDRLTVEEGILGLVTCSANDAATVLAEGMAGSESAFAWMMTQKARELGMTRTVFRNASGLPDPNQVTTARDMFRLGKALTRDFPQFYRYFSTAAFHFGGRSFRNHNHLLETYPGADGIKTGFINASGYNLVASAQRNGQRLIGVVFGGPSAQRRDALMREILDDGFAQLEGAPPAVHLVEFDRTAPGPHPAVAEATEAARERAVSGRPRARRAVMAARPARLTRHEQRVLAARASTPAPVAAKRSALARLSRGAPAKTKLAALLKNHGKAPAATRSVRKTYLAKAGRDEAPTCRKHSKCGSAH